MTKTANVESIEESKSPSQAPDTGQSPAGGRPRHLVLAGVAAAFLAAVTLMCICLVVSLWLQGRDGPLPQAAIPQQEQIAPMAMEEVPMVQPEAPAAMEKVPMVQQEAPAAMEEVPMVQQEAPAAASLAFEQQSVPAAPPTIQYFWADPPSIDPGRCSTLRWGAVLGATWAGIEPGIGGIGTPGDKVVCPGRTTTYILTAEGPGGRSFASATVGVGTRPDRGTVVLQSEGPLDGYRSNDGRGSIRHDILAANAEMIPGFGEVVWRGFMSFDLSAIPRQRVIQGAELRFFQVRVGGDPYGKLGRLLLEHVAYGNRLEDAAYHVARMDVLVLNPQRERKTWYVVAAPRLREWIAQDLAAGRTRFQVRLRWEQETDGDGLEDYASIESPENFFNTGNAPELTVTYGP